MLNQRASTDARHARYGSNAMLYNEDGEALAQVDSFTAKANFSNSKYDPIGQRMNLEVNGTVDIAITISEIVVIDGYLFNQLLDAVTEGESPVMALDGAIEGRNGTQERITYRECIFSGDNDLQNVTSGEVLKRSYNLHCNSMPEKRSELTI